MKNKGSLLKLGLMVASIGCLGLSMTSATNFALNLKGINSLGNEISNKIYPIHFADNGNDFGGFLYFSNNVAADESEDEEYYNYAEGGNTLFFKNITISNGETAYTVMDRNLGVTNAGMGVDSYGKYYNWSEIEGLPCPTGYHVPSKEEWQGVYGAWCGTNNCNASDRGEKFAESLKLPLAGGSDSNGNELGALGAYRASTSNNSEADYLRFDTESINTSTIVKASSKLPIRCFKDEPDMSVVENGGGEGDADEENLFYIKVNGNVGKECKRHIKGFYYNAERGDRLRPLDEETLESFDNNQAIVNGKIVGGLYTLCRPAGYSEALAKCQEDYADQQLEEEQGEDDNVDTLESCVRGVDNDFAQEPAYYGMITWKMKEQFGGETFSFVAGVKYNSRNGNHWISPINDGGSVELSSNFIRWQNRIPVGFVYDYNGGLGFVGCEIMPGISDKISTLDELVGKQENLATAFKSNGKGGIKYVCDGNVTDDQCKAKVNCENVGMAGDSLIKLIIEGLVGVDRESDLGVLGNQLDSKMQYFSSADINTSTLMNYAKQRSEILCRGKWKTKNYVATDRTNSDIVCLSGTNVQASDAKSISEGAKTLIVKNGNVIVEPFTTASESYYYDVFINGGNLIINEKSNPNFVFSEEGFILEDKSIDDFKSAVSVLEIPGNTYDNTAGVAVGSFIRGNFIVDGKVQALVSDQNRNDKNLHNKYFIHGKLSTRDSFKDFEKKFAWRCVNGYTVDKNGDILDEQGRYCPPSVYQNASLVVIDQTYDSPLYW